MSRRMRLLVSAAVLTLAAAAIVLVGQREDDDPPPQRSALEARAVEECVKATTSQVQGTPDEDSLDVEAYCECYIPELIEGAGEDRAKVTALVERIELGRPPDRAIPIASRCAAETAE